MGGIDGRGKFKMASTSTPSVKKPATILVRTEKLKAMIKGPISVKLVSSGISHVAFASVLLGKNRLKKLMIMIIIIIITEKPFTSK